MSRVVAILLAAGSSNRFREDKLMRELHGEPLWCTSYRKLLEHPRVDAVGVVTRAEKVNEYRAMAPEALFVIEGGTSRQESAQLGLQALPPEAEIVLYHDAARPYVSNSLISKVIDGVEEAGAAFPALPVTNTIKRLTSDRVETLFRDELVSVQTPQGGRREFFERAYREVTTPVTDDMSLLEAIGVVPKPVPGDPHNVKITYPDDLREEALATEIRTGLGYDIHAFSKDPARPLWLGGVEFLGEGPGLEGHSDADCLLHAVVDAVLGAIGEGDIGALFPNDEPRWKNEPSATFLQAAVQKAQEKRWEIVNIDVSVLAERPKIGPRREQICRRISEIAQIDMDRVSVKATTNEKLGAIGRQEGAAAFAVATLSKKIGDS
ncbi:MAG: 2-C-methyl-D-erythritol 2,4-cyclodiphosphate synthase [Fimbriimonadaceae bacterium]